MNMHELAGKRIICLRKIPGRDEWMKVNEYQVVEVSPSGEWVKLSFGNSEEKWWERAIDIHIIEVLKGDRLIGRA